MTSECIDSRAFTLDAIGILHGTDKATQHPVVKPSHGYTVYYEWAFHPLRDRDIKLLEIGVGGGESIRMWLDYFSRGQIYGLDKVCDTNPWNTRGGSSCCGWRPAQNQATPIQASPRATPIQRTPSSAHPE